MSVREVPLLCAVWVCELSYLGDGRPPSIPAPVRVAHILKRAHVIGWQQAA